MSKHVDRIKEDMSRTAEPVRFKITKDMLLSTGSTNLNLAMTGRTDGGFCKGCYYRFVGDSASGKTFLCLTCLAEASINPNFDDYQLIHDNAENGAQFTFRRFFGKRLEDRVQPPAGTREDPIYSLTVEDSYDYFEAAMDRGPCIYITDSMDCLVPRADVKKHKKMKASRDRERSGRAGTEEAGDYGAAKAKINSQMLRMMIPKMTKTGSILIIISQAKDMIGGGFAPPGADMRRGSGGHALKFYAACELWTSSKGKIYKAVRGKQREQGIHAKVRIKKNRHTGRDRTAIIPIYHSHGIDDTGAMVDYLVEEKHWKENEQGTVTTPEYGKMNHERLIQRIESKGEVPELRKLVKKIWNEIETESSVKRRNRYA